ncbi:hypothetical protein [Nocardia sp. NBC_01388]|uniref:hypothetical protein n=1 Tax=Nocardia sp. NBC_01388 TaxID=2903596 RepID=UPI0032568A2D
MVDRGHLGFGPGAQRLKDTSRQGRWHNERYRALGEELGLTLAHQDKIGWSITTVPDQTRELYRDELDELARRHSTASRHRIILWRATFST